MRLEERRKALGLSRKEAAKKVGISEVSMWQYEKGGGYKPKTEVAIKLAELYGCTIPEVMEGCGPGEANDAGRVEESL